MDMNPYANNNTQQATSNSPAIPSTTPAGGIANMIKAIMDGNDAYKQRQQQLLGNQGMKTPGQPMSLAAPQDPTNPMGTGTSQPVGGFMSMPQQGLAGMVPSGGGMDPFSSQNSPVSIDPVTQALMSPIPGM